jgi:hypothetical protein
MKNKTFIALNSKKDGRKFRRWPWVIYAYVKDGIIVVANAANLNAISLNNKQ